MFKTNEIYSALFLITIVFIVISAGFVVFMISYKIKQGKHLKEKKTMETEFDKQLMQSQIEVQEMTFNDLGKELHDNIGQLLSSTKMLLGVTQRSMAHVPESLNLAEETLGNAINDLRALTKALDREWLEQFDLITNLTTEIGRINASKTLNIEFHHHGKLPMEAQKQIILFRIVQEALQNAIKHAEASQVAIAIKIANSNIILTIADNGKGLGSGSFMNGLGIRNMKHRTKLLGGTIDWESTVIGATVSINLTIQDN